MGEQNQRARQGRLLQGYPMKVRKQQWDVTGRCWKCAGEGASAQKWGHSRPQAWREWEMRPVGPAMGFNTWTHGRVPAEGPRLWTLLRSSLPSQCALGGWNQLPPSCHVLENSSWDSSHHSFHPHLLSTLRSWVYSRH